MCPQRFVPKDYDSKKLAVLQEVFDSGWGLLRLRYPNLKTAQEDKLKAALAKAIVDLAVAGVTDKHELFQSSIKSVLAALKED
jgi:hypothetical protein